MKLQRTLMRKILLLGSTLALTGCPGAFRQVIPDDGKPHELSRGRTNWIWVLRSDGKWVEEKVEAQPGWVLGSPAAFPKKK